jgi:hypothetical protein
MLRRTKAAKVRQGPGCISWYFIHWKALWLSVSYPRQITGLYTADSPDKKALVHRSQKTWLEVTSNGIIRR